MCIWVLSRSFSQMLKVLNKSISIEVKATAMQRFTSATFNTDMHVLPPCDPNFVRAVEVG